MTNDSDRDYDAEFDSIVYGSVLTDEKFRKSSEKASRKLTGSYRVMRYIVVPLVLLFALGAVGFALVPAGYPQALFMTGVTVVGIVLVAKMIGLWPNFDKN